MSNTAILSNFSEYKFTTIGHNNIKDESIVKNTQNKLKKLVGGELPLEMLRSVTKSMSEDLPVVSSLCNTVDKWIVSSNKILEVPILNKLCIEKFIEEVKLEDDFKKIFLFEDEKINLWLIVEEANYDINIKYIRLAREIFDTRYLDINLMIYSYDELDEVLDEIEGSEYSYKEYE